MATPGENRPDAEANVLEAHMQMAGERIVFVPMSARTFVDLLRDHKLQEDQILGVARDYVEQEKQYARDLAWEKLQLWNRINNLARDYVFAESDLIMEMRVLPTEAKRSEYHRANIRSRGARAAPYTEPAAEGQR